MSGARSKARCASRSRSMPRPRAAACFQCASRCASACPARRGHAIIAPRRHQRQERLRGRSRHRHLLRRADGLGAGDALPGRPRPHRRRARRRHSARSLDRRRAPAPRRLRPDLALWPTGKFEWSVPGPPRFEGKRFPSLEAALADGPKCFEELMTAVGSRDGRELVRASRSAPRQGPHARRAGPLYMPQG